MSMHEIEDFVEESLRLVLTGDDAVGDKRSLVELLYAVQGWFDTDDTSARLADELAAIGYVGNAALTPVQLLPLAAVMMERGLAAGRFDIAHGWLALTLTAMTDLDLGGSLPESFDAMFADGAAVRIRAVASGMRLHNRRGKDLFVRLPKWSELAEDYPAFEPATIEMRFMLRYLADPAKAEAIQAAFRAERDRMGRLDGLPLFSIPQCVAELTPLVYLGMETDCRVRRFVFADRIEAPKRDEARIFVVVRYDQNVSTLAFEVRVQSGLLVDWCCGSGGNGLADTHFALPHSSIVPQKVLEADPWYSNGNWSYSLDQSEAQLAKRLNAIVAHFPYIERVRAFHLVPLAERLTSSRPAMMRKKLPDLWQTVGFFENETELLFAYARLAWERGHPEAAIAEVVRDIDLVCPEDPMKPIWAAGAAILREQPWFPPLLAGCIARRLDWL